MSDDFQRDWWIYTIHERGRLRETVNSFEKVGSSPSFRTKRTAYGDPLLTYVSTGWGNPVMVGTRLDIHFFWVKSCAFQMALAKQGYYFAIAGHPYFPH